MLLRTQPIAPLETIYEESGSFIASSIDIQHRFNSYGYSNETINGLISARSIPPVDIQRRRVYDHQQKPPIEVRFRDGSKRYIQPSTVPPMIINRRDFVDSSQKNLSSNRFSNKTLTEKQTHSRAPLVITIITADDLEQAGITPTISSSSDDSEKSARNQALSKSSMTTTAATTTTTVTTNIQKDNNQNSTQRAQITPTQLIVEKLPSVTKSSLQSPVNYIQQPLNVSNQNQNTVSFQQTQSLLGDTFTMSTRASSASSSKPVISSLNITVTNDENKQKSLSSSYPQSIISSSKQSSIKTVNPTNRSGGRLLPGGGSRSAFRPFNKVVRFNDQLISSTSTPTSNTSQPTLNVSQTTSNVPHSTSDVNQKSNDSAKQQFVSHTQTSQLKQPSAPLTSITQVSTNNPTAKWNSLVTNPTYDAMMLKQRIPNTTRNISTFISINPTKNQNQSLPLSISTIDTVNNNLTLPRVLNISNTSGQTLSVALNSNLKWYNVKPKSLNEIPRLSTQYSSIPLRIDLPVATPTHNQRLLEKHDLALENRLLNAGLSPETVALYERILHIAENPKLPKLSTPLMTKEPSNKESNQ